MDQHASSSSLSYAFTYDVFLSFTGSDTRHSFTGNLYKTLCDKGIHTFIDDQKLPRGDEITEALVKAIKESRIAIPVFSINYAYSSFCLDELVTIIDYIKTNGRLVLPVFYNIDPSHVRQQTETYGKAVSEHEAKFKNNKDKLKRLQKWKTALTQVANLAGFHYKHGDGYEHEFIGNIVKEVSKKINRVPLHVADYPVGLESHLLNVKSLLDVGSDGVHMIGIHGIGGGGKTTLALAIYNSIARDFPGLCFLEKVRENSSKLGLQHMQITLLSKILGENNIELTSVREGMPMIRHRLQGKKVLLILDDVDKDEQLQAIAGGLDWFGPGSRIILTTRDRQLLARNNVKRTYEVKGLNKEDALQLLRWKAFKSENVDPSYVNVLNRVIAYASGLPLALEVIGSNLYGKSIEEWESAINQYERIPNGEILKVLKISFDALGEEEKNVFLDIACFFKEYNLELVKDMLHVHQGYRVEYHIRVLDDKSLIKIGSHGIVTLHDLIEDMAKEIVRQESPREPGKRSRLWYYEDIIQVLEHNEGTGEIEIIYLQFPFEEREKEVEWDGDAFTKMKNLKTIDIRNGHFLNGPKHLPNSLRVLKWEKYPWQDLPDDFHPKKLTICELSRSCLTSANFILRKEFSSLTNLNFDWCEYLTEIPDVSCLRNLECLSFSKCRNLSTIHHSVGLLDKLKFLDAAYCLKLKSFPPIKLTSLEALDFGNSGLESFPEVLGKMENIKELCMSDTPIKKIPHSFRNLVGLQLLQMSCPGELSHSEADSFLQSIATMPKLTVIESDYLAEFPLPSGYEDEDKVSSSNIQIIRLSDTQLTEEFFVTIATLFANVKELILPDNDFRIIPECIKECIFLKKLILSDCVYLEEIKGIPPNLKCFEADGCESLSPLCRRMFLNQDLHEAGHTQFYLPATEIPEWFEHRSRETSISFWFCNKFPPLVLYFGVLPNHPFVEFKKFLKLRITNNIPFICINGEQYSIYPHSGFAETCVIDLRLLTCDYNFNEALVEDEWNRAELRYEDHPYFPNYMKIGIHVLKQEWRMEDVRFADPCKKRKLEDHPSSSEPQSNQMLKKKYI